MDGLPVQARISQNSQIGQVLDPRVMFKFSRMSDNPRTNTFVVVMFVIQGSQLATRIKAQPCTLSRLQLHDIGSIGAC